MFYRHGLFLCFVYTLIKIKKAALEAAKGFYKEFSICYKDTKSLIMSVLRLRASAA